MSLLIFIFTAFVLFCIGSVPAWAVIEMWEDLSLEARLLALASLIIVYTIIIIVARLILVHSSPI